MTNNLRNYKQNLTRRKNKSLKNNKTYANLKNNLNKHPKTLNKMIKNDNKSQKNNRNLLIIKD